MTQDRYYTILDEYDTSDVSNFDALYIDERDLAGMTEQDVREWLSEIGLRRI